MAHSTLSSSAEIIMGQSPPGETCNIDGRGLPLLNGPTEFGPHHPSPVQFTTDPRKRAQPGDILFCVRGSTTGRMNWADREYAIGRGVAAIRHKNNRLLQPFVRAVVENGLSGLLAQATGSTFPNVSATQLAELYYPQLEEEQQFAIAYILGTLDDKIELNRKMNQTLEAMARAIFKSWFVDFDPVRAKAAGRDPGLPADLAALFPDNFEDSESGEIPKGWKATTLKDAIVIHDSKRIPLSSRERAERKGQYPYYGAASVMDYVDDYLFDGVYVLLGEDGSVVNDDDTPVVQYVWGKFWVNNHAHVLTGKNNVSVEHLQLFLKQINIRSFVTGAVQPKLNQGNLCRVPFILPSDAVCRAFSKMIEPLYARIRANTDESRALAVLRDALLPKLLSGEIRVKD